MNATATNTGKKTTSNVRVFFLIGVILFAWKVWPTPYVLFESDGGEVPTKRCSRLTGNVQVRDPLTGYWVEEGQEFKLDRQSESERILKNWNKQSK